MSNTFPPGPTPNAVRAADGKVLAVPEGWVLLPPGSSAHLSQLILRPGPERVLLNPDAVSHAGWHGPVAILLRESIALLVECLDDFRCEDRWGEKAFLAVNHQ